MYSDELGYTPNDFNTWLALFVPEINRFSGTTYDLTSIVGTNYYNFMYPMIQALVQGDAVFSEVWEKFILYVEKQNQMIMKPIISNEGIIDYLKTWGYDVSIKKMTTDDAGKLYLCFDTGVSDSIEKARKAGLLNQCVTAGIWTAGDVTQNVTLTNGQTFPYNWEENPELVNLDLKLTMSIESGQISIPSADEIAVKLRENLNTIYKIGSDFAPIKFWDSSRDAPYAKTIKLEYSEDAGSTWKTVVKEMLYTQKLAFNGIDVVFA